MHFANIYGKIITDYFLTKGVNNMENNKKYNIVLTDCDTVNAGDLNLRELEEFGNVTYYGETPQSQVAERIKDADILILNTTVIGGVETTGNMELSSAHNTLKAENCPDNCTLICDSHSNVLDYVSEKICAGVFNLGYLPGGGHKEITTLRPTTRKAVEAAISLLDKDAIILIAVYPGHEEGKLEGEMLDEYLRTFDRRKICVSRFQIVNSPTSPFFFAVESK